MQLSHLIVVCHRCIEFWVCTYLRNVT